MFFVITYELANFRSDYPYDLSHTPVSYNDSAYAAYPFYLDSTSEVGRYGANNYGLYDMHGNVYEWCWDWYDDYSVVSEKDYHGPESPSAHGVIRVIRGGCWNGYGYRLRSAYRTTENDAGKPETRRNMVGFRVIRP